MAKALHTYQVIVRPLITEKATILTGEHKYAFEVVRRANKNQIRDAVELAFNVHVVKVNTMNVRGKRRRTGRLYTRTRAWKKAIVTLVEGDTIQVFEGI
ncbi:MAG: 50S ribosomal protein L23 [Chloroflexi bacterium]|nr:50S ribosomal protein L23 [Chloroflexota bacterium]